MLAAPTGERQHHVVIMGVVAQEYRDSDRVAGRREAGTGGGSYALGGALCEEHVHERLVHGQPGGLGKRVGLRAQAGAAAVAHARLHRVDAQLRVLQRTCSGSRGCDDARVQPGLWRCLKKSECEIYVPHLLGPRQLRLNGTRFSATHVTMPRA